jgi:hypothetical protein
MLHRIGYEIQFQNHSLESRTKDDCLIDIKEIDLTGFRSP